MGACTDPVATNTIPSAPRRERGEKRFLTRGLFGGRSGRGGTRPSPLPVLQIRRTPEAQGPTLSWVGGPSASERGGVWLSVNALASAESWQAEGWKRQVQAEGLKRQVQASRAAESAQSWGDSEQLLSWSAWAGSVAKPVMPSVPL